MKEFNKQKMKRWFLLSLVSVLFSCSSFAFEKKQKRVIPAAERMDVYLPVIKNKKIGLLVNQTARVGDQLLLDTLLKRGVNVVKVFVPEHGFRGNADAGAHVKSDTDPKTGLPVISLYGNQKKPSAQQLKDIDLVIYDLQDVGVRFYTYISSLQYMMEACAENNKELLILDRPNPNGHYVDGPVLEKSEKSFVGMQPIPVVYGMTAGEYAKMLVGEKWLQNPAKLNMQVVKCENYSHKTRYVLPVHPSPNLRNMASVYLYPSLCFFEGTVVSVGRGTEYPFQQWGHPAFKGKTDYFFIPQSVTGASNPPLKGRKCFGKLLASTPEEALKMTEGKLNLSWLIDAYRWYPEKEKFFNDFFEKLAGTRTLKKQIISGMSEEEIRKTWEEDIMKFKEIRKKYLVYD